nr:MAG TPA: hypothetical protein [Caudoviricetes sp.]
MGTRKRPFEWLFLIHDFLTLRVAKLCECGDFLLTNYSYIMYNYFNGRTVV